MRSRSRCKEICTRARKSGACRICSQARAFRRQAKPESWCTSSTSRRPLICVGLILISSLYVMSNKDIQTEDRYFNGFPAMWNLVVNVLFVLQGRRWINVIVVLALVICTFVPVKFIHPIRVRDFRKITIPILVVWLGAMLYVTWILDERTANCASHCLGAGPEIAQGVVYAGSVWILGVGLWRTFRGAPTTQAPVTRRTGSLPPTAHR